ncbi:MAG: diadenylate cyclase, partial [Flavobacteriales bacterium]
QEIRKFLLLIGNKSFGSRKEILKRFQKAESSQQNLTTELILDAVKHLSATKTGSILVFKANTDLSFIEATGTRLDAKVSSELIESIFFKNSPLHDGATIIDHQKITHATCVLPVSDRRDLPTIFGLRHRAALGLSESTDALILIISEETGRISVCKEGELHPDLSIEECRTFISKN